MVGSQIDSPTQKNTFKNLEGLTAENAIGTKQVVAISGAARLVPTMFVMRKAELPRASLAP